MSVSTTRPAAPWGRFLALAVVAGSILASRRVGAALLSSVQSGTTISVASGTVTVTITSIDPTKSFLVFQTRGNSNRPVASQLRGRIASTTTLEFARVTDELVPDTINIQWYVATFASGVTVQRGEVAQSTTTIDVPITAVGSLSRAFVLWSKTPDPADTTWGLNDPIVGELTSTTNLEFRVQLENAGHTISWQVVEFTTAADINVQKGSIASMVGTTTSVTATLSPAVDVSRTFVLVGYRSNASGASVGARMLRAQLTDSTTITIDRSISGAPDDLPEIAWQAVELKDGTSVQRGTANLPSGTAETVVNLGTSVDPRRSLVFSGVQPVGGQNMGRTPYAGDDIVGVGTVTMALSSTQITMDRNNTADSADIGWFLLQFKTRRVMIVSPLSPLAPPPALASRRLRLAAGGPLTPPSLQKGKIQQNVRLRAFRYLRYCPDYPPRRAGDL